MISDFVVRGRYLTREWYHVMRDLIDRHGWRHLETQDLLSEPLSFRDRIRQRCGGVTPDVVLFWEAYDLVTSVFEQLSKENFCVAIFSEDLHWFRAEAQKAKTAALNVADVILASYAPVFDRFFPAAAATKPVVWVPHAASPEFMLPLNESAQNVIFLSGMINNCYPLRQRLKSLAVNRDLHIVEHPHPGYHCNHDHQTSAAVGAGYARRINAARASFTDSSKFKYVLAKFFEIPATGSLLVGDATIEGQLSRLGFAPRVHYIPVSDATLEDELFNILDARNHADLDQVRVQGQLLVRTRHKISDRSKLIDDACTSREQALVDHF